jgi:isopenicillin-N epimerase
MRDAFLLDPDIVFLNHGSFGACPREVLDAWQGWQLEMERNPVEFLGRRSANLLHDARRQLASTLGARGDDLVFVPNATTGVNIVARSLALQPGDEVLTTDQEYGACEATWQQVCAARGAVYRRVEIPLPFDAAGFAARMLAQVAPRTKVIFASHVSSTTALVFPLAELCAAARERGILTLIDGAHAPGQVDLALDALGGDYYTGNCHKWMCAPKGAGFLHARPERQAQLDAPVTSWGYVAEGMAQSGHTGFDAYTGKTLFERRLQWQGTRDISAWLAVPAAIDFQQRHGWPEHRRRCHAMACTAQRTVLARNGLAPIAPDDCFGQMVPIPVRVEGAASAEALRRHLFDDHRIEVPVTQHAGRTFVRLSVQAYTTQAEVDALVAALAAAGV